MRHKEISQGRLNDDISPSKNRRMIEVRSGNLSHTMSIAAAEIPGQYPCSNGSDWADDT